MLARKTAVKVGDGGQSRSRLSSGKNMKATKDLSKQKDSTPLASKVHCSINGLENSSSPEYSKVQHLLEITVGLFSVGVGLFFVTGGLGKSPPPTKKSPTPTEKSPTLTVKSPTYKKSSSNQKKVLLQRKKVLL